MAKQVVIRISEGGNFEDGFPVFLEFWEDGTRFRTDYDCPPLPPNPQIPLVYDKWKEIYTQLGERPIDVSSPQITNSSILEDCREATQALESTVIDWFSYLAFDAITGRILKRLNGGVPDESVRIIIDTSLLFPSNQVDELRDLQISIPITWLLLTWLRLREYNCIAWILFLRKLDQLNQRKRYLHKLPWNCWELLPQAEFALLSKYNRPGETFQTPIKILAIFGSDRGGLQLTQDRELIDNLKQHGATITTIPARGNHLTPQELFDKIWMGNWDIIFYAGHSSSHTIAVDHTLNLSIDDISEALMRAAPNVKLAIFNSCDGLDMAEYLADIGIPNLIVMREAVADLVARSFLKFFLEEFTQGKPLHAAVRDARKRLQRLEIPSSSDEVFYPGASWLPILLQNPASPELYWPQPQPEPEPKNLFLQLWKTTLLLLIMTGLSGLFFLLKAFDPEIAGDKISKGEEILTSSEPRLKQKGVKPIEKCQKPLKYFLPVWKSHIRERWSDCFVTHENHQRSAQYLQQSWQEERRDPETLIYLNNALLEVSGEDYHTIAVVVPLLQNKAGEVVDAELAEEILRGVAQAQTEVNLSLFQDKKPDDIKLPGSDFLKLNDLNGKGLKVIIANDANSKAQAKQVAETLVKRSEVLGVVGPYTSEMTMATVETYNSNQLVMVSPGTTTSEITKDPQPFFFRTPTTNHVQAEVAVDVLLNQLNHKKAAIFYNPASPYSADYQRKFRQKFLELGGEIVGSFNLSSPNFNAERAIQKIRNGNEAVDRSSPDFNPEATKQEIRSAGETAIVLIPDGQVTNSLANALEVIKEDQGQSWIVGNWSTYTYKTLQINSPQLLEKFFITIPWHHLNSPNPDFPKTSLQLWNGPVSPRTALTYDATQVLIEGIQQNPSRHGVQKALADENFSIDGVTGTIEFKPGTGDRKDRPIELVRVVPCPNRMSGLTFLPMKFSTPEEAGLNCSNP